ncbi:MAG: hypothetical protein HYV14_06755 [Elusimicrobia bacterium]|nr:hypothetical protein [Elusimicrobiota bacterium]
MDEIIKVIAYPIVILILGLVFMSMFKSPITNLIGRARKVKLPGFDADTEALAQPTTTNQNTPAISQPAHSDSPANAPSDTHILNMEALREFDSPLLVEIENNIYAELEKRKINPPVGSRPGAVTLLVKSLGKLIIQTQFEGIYDHIFRSQLEILAHLNSLAPKGETEKSIKEYYTKAQEQQPRLKDYAFTNFIGYLLAHQLIRKDGNIFAATVKGREFLSYIPSSGKSFVRPL